MSPKWNPKTQGGKAVRALTWVGQGQLEAHHLWRAARGPGWGAAASRGAEGGLLVHILVEQEE